MDLGETISLRRTQAGMSHAALAQAAGVGEREIRRYEAGDQEPPFSVLVAITAALDIPAAELARMAGQLTAGPDQALGRIRHGIEFIAQGDSGGVLRITGDDDAAVLLWGAQWLDEHRDWIITDIRFQHPARAGDDGLTASVVLQLTSPGTLPPDEMRPRLGPWSHGVPPMPV